MKTELPKELKTIEEATKFLHDLTDNGEAYHPEDSAHNIIWNLEEEPTEEECDHLNKLMDDIYDLEWIGTDPCGIIMDRTNG